MNIGKTYDAARARRWLRGCAPVGNRPQLIGKPSIDCYGGQVRIGDGFRLASRPVASHLVAGPSAVLEIGNDVSIGCGAAIAAFEHIHIGDGTQIGPYVIIMDTNFHGSAGDQSVQHECRPVMIGNGCRIGSRVTITRGVTIGDGAEILAGSVVSSAIPPRACAAGARARIVGRAGEEASRWNGAAVQLPDMLMAALDLGSTPNIDDGAIPAQHWNDAGIQRLLDAIEDRFAVTLGTAAAREFESFADIAAALETALNPRTSPAAR